MPANPSLSLLTGGPCVNRTCDQRIKSPKKAIFTNKGKALIVRVSPLFYAGSPDSETFGFVAFCLDLLSSDGYKNGYSLLDASLVVTSLRFCLGNRYFQMNRKIDHLLL